MCVPPPPPDPEACVKLDGIAEERGCRRGTLEQTAGKKPHPAALVDCRELHEFFAWFTVFYDDLRVDLERSWFLDLVSLRVKIGAMVFLSCQAQSLTGPCNPGHRGQVFRVLAQQFADDLDAQ